MLIPAISRHYFHNHMTTFTSHLWVGDDLHTHKGRRCLIKRVFRQRLGKYLASNMNIPCYGSWKWWSKNEGNLAVFSWFQLPTVSVRFLCVRNTNAYGHTRCIGNSLVPLINYMESFKMLNIEYDIPYNATHCDLVFDSSITICAIITYFLQERFMVWYYVTGASCL